MRQYHSYQDDGGSPSRHWGLEVLAHGQFDDRNSNKRAYQAWTGMLRGRICPSIEDLEPSGVAGPRDVLIDLRCDSDDPQIACVGGALIADCGRRGLQRLSQVPAESYLALLTAHCRYAALIRHPIAFEGRRPEGQGRTSAYLGILLPFSSDGRTVDFLQGRIGWHEPAERDLCDRIRLDLQRARTRDVPASTCPVWPHQPALELTGAV